MLKILMTRIKQGRRTISFPNGKAPELPGRYRGRPIIAGSDKEIDMGGISFAPDDGIRYSNDYRTSASKRRDLIVRSNEKKLAKALNDNMLKVFGRSLRLRHVSAGGCNACEADLNVLNTVVFDLSRFGIQFAASPRHADGIIVTGPVTRNMKEGLIRTYEAVSDPKIVIAVGNCAISGGIFAESLESGKGLDAIIPVDLYIPGCPPHPLTTLDGMLRLLGRIK